MIKIKYLDTYPAKLKPAKRGDAGIDIVAAEDTKIGGFDTKLISTGLYLEIPEGYYGRLVGRSSLHKQGLHVNEGIIDSGYRGEVKVSLTNLNQKLIMRFVDLKDLLAGRQLVTGILKGDRIAQLIITKVEPVEFVAVEELSDSERGSKGFGSSGR